MTHTFDHVAHAVDTARAATHTYLALTALSLLLLVLFSAPVAYAKTEEAPKRATVSKAMMTQGAVELRGACRDGVAVFTVKNNAARWAGRGHLRITDGKTGHVLRERWLRFSEGQSASFHIEPQLVASARYKVSVMLPDRSMTYKKSFRGRCAAPTVEARNAVGNSGR